MVAGNDNLSEFVSGSKYGRATSFCTLCVQDVSIEGRGIGEINSWIVIENVNLSRPQGCSNLSVASGRHAY